MFRSHMLQLSEEHHFNNTPESTSHKSLVLPPTVEGYTNIAKSIVVGMGVKVIVRRRLCDRGVRTSGGVDLRLYGGTS